jgi:hypothetical protein
MLLQVTHIIQKILSYEYRRREDGMPIVVIITGRRIGGNNFLTSLIDFLDNLEVAKRRTI